MLSMSHGIHFGKMRSVATGLGSVSAALVLMMASAAGLGAIISASEYGFTLLKWCGAAYLVFLGIKLLLTKNQSQTLEVSQLKGKGTPRQLYQQAFLVGISNPKDLLFLPRCFHNLSILPRRNYRNLLY